MQMDEKGHCFGLKPPKDSKTDKKIAEIAEREHSKANGPVKTSWIVECVDCGKAFFTDSKSVVRCDECRKVHISKAEHKRLLKAAERAEKLQEEVEQLRVEIGIAEGDTYRIERKLERVLQKHERLLIALGAMERMIKE